MREGFDEKKTERNEKILLLLLNNERIQKNKKIKNFSENGLDILISMC